MRQVVAVERPARGLGRIAADVDNPIATLGVADSAQEWPDRDAKMAAETTLHGGGGPIND